MMEAENEMLLPFQGTCFMDINPRHYVCMGIIPLFLKGNYFLRAML